MVGQFFFSTLKSPASSRAACGVIVRERRGAVPLSSTRPRGPTVTGAPSGRPVWGSSCVTPTVPRRTVMVVVNRPAMVPLAAVFATSATTTVPRIPTTQFGVLISTDSPGRILSFATAIASRPSPSSTVAVDGTSLTVRVGRTIARAWRYGREETRRLGVQAGPAEGGLPASPLHCPRARPQRRREPVLIRVSPRRVQQA